jgi:alpha-N-arabinofuranosidase
VGHYDIHEGQRRFPEISEVPYLDVLATRDSKRNNLVVFVVNRDWKNSITGTVELGGFAPAPDVLAHTLSGGSLLDRNDEENPERVRPMNSTLRAEGTSLRHTFPAASLTVLVFKPR